MIKSLQKQDRKKIYEDPVFTVEECHAKQTETDKSCSPIFNKPKPKIVEQPKEKPKDAPKSDKDGDKPMTDESDTSEQSETSTKSEKPTTDTEVPPSTDNMDVD